MNNVTVTGGTVSGYCKFNPLASHHTLPLYQDNLEPVSDFFAAVHIERFAKITYSYPEIDFNVKIFLDNQTVLKLFESCNPENTKVEVCLEVDPI